MDIYAQTVSNRALATATPQTIIQLVTPATVRAQLTKVSFSFDGISSVAEPIDCFIVTQSTAGTSSGGTPSKLDPGAPTALVTTLITFTVEPGADSNEIWRDMVHPQGGLYEVNWALGDRTAPLMAVSTRLGLKFNAPAGVNVSATVQWVE